MNYKGKSISLQRKEPASMVDIVPMMMKVMKLSSGMNDYLVMRAWDTVTGAAPYTLSRYVKGKTLYCSISSSVVRNQLFFNKESIISSINNAVLSDPLYSSKEGDIPLKNLILK